VVVETGEVKEGCVAGFVMAVTTTGDGRHIFPCKRASIVAMGKQLKGVTMKVKDAMNETVRFCHFDASLAEATAMMWEHDCGALPVVADGKKTVGIITDRDIAIAVGTRSMPAWAIPVSDAMSKVLYSVSAEDDIHTALKLMRKDKVRRLPVIDKEGRLEGILSLNDIALHAEHPNGKTTPALSYEDVVSTFKAICEHRHRTVKQQCKIAGA
jgi:CBS domain-containing protein